MGKPEVPKWITEHVPEELQNSHLFRFHVTFPNGTRASIDLLEDLDINFDMLEHHLETIPAQYMFWASVYSELRSLVTTWEIKISRRRAWMVKNLLGHYKEAGIKLTDKQLQQLIDSDGADKAEITSEIRAQNKSKREPSDETVVEDQIKEEYNRQLKKTLPYLEAQLAIQQKNTGKVYHMVEAIRMRSENCRSLAGFKRQEKEQAGQTT